MTTMNIYYNIKHKTRKRKENRKEKKEWIAKMATLARSDEWRHVRSVSCVKLYEWTTTMFSVFYGCMFWAFGSIISIAYVPPQCRFDVPDSLIGHGGSYLKYY